MDLQRAPDLFFAGALIYKEKGGELVPTWRYRVEPFQRAVEASGDSYSEIELRCGFQGSHGSYLKRLLGLKSWQSGARDKNGKRYMSFATSLSYENAVKIARALDLDFVEWEL